MSCACDLSSAARLRQVELYRWHCSSGEAQLCQGHRQDSVFCLVPTRGNSHYLIFHHMPGLCWSVHENHLVLSSIDEWHTDDGYAEHAS